MKMLSMDRVQELDAAHGAEVRDLVRHIKLSTLFHEDNVGKVTAMADALNLTPEELSMYVWLQAYTKELRESFDPVTPLDVAAQHIGFSTAELEAYVCGRDTVMTAEEYRDYLEDLQEDAGLQGD